MKKSCYLVVFISLLMTACSTPAQDTSVKKEVESYPGYKLLWADEFDKDGRPDPCSWNYERGFVRNEELQWYQPENAFCQNGLLIIESRRERKENPDYDPNSNNWRRNREYCQYTSSSITTRRLHSWMYGRFEMRGRIDTRPGIWPAFWTLGIRGRWPGSGEIDIMEYYRGMLLANAAWAADRRNSPKWDDSRKPITEFDDPNWSEKFHLWRMDWDVNSISLYVDDILLNEIDLTQTFNAGTDRINPFRQPHYIILNLAIGGTNGGDPSDTRFPSKFEIDFVRVYRKISDTPAESQNI